MPDTSQPSPEAPWLFPALVIACLVSLGWALHDRNGTIRELQAALNTAPDTVYIEVPQVLDASELFGVQCYWVTDSTSLTAANP